MTPQVAPGLLRRLAALLIRGPEAAFILVDLDDALERDLVRGIPAWRARLRYAVNVFASAFSVWRLRWSLPRIRPSWIDVKLGLRMLVKNPGLTCVALFALSIGIPVGLGPMHFANAIEAPLPVDEGERVLLLRHWNAATARPDTTTFSEFSRWNSTLTSFQSLGAARTSSYNIGSGSELAAPSLGAEVTASTFDLLRVPPLLGRTLRETDEAFGAPAVVVLGHDLWRSRFGSDSTIVGRTIDIGRIPHTVVGVMPAGFLFPQRQQLWLPLRERPATEPRQGLPLIVVGRLADGTSPDEAHVELTAVGRGMAAEFPDIYVQLQPEVVPTAYMVFGFSRGGLRAQMEYGVAQVLTLLPLIVACLNVGLLIFARTTRRSGEFAVRTALGASRARILSQVFTESLVLAVLAAGAGLMLFGWLPGRLLAMTGLTLPYWIDFGLTSSTVLWALALAIVSAVGAGVVPAVRVTSRSVQRNIQTTTAKRSGARFGGLSGVLLVADVAVAVAAIGFAAALTDLVRDTWQGQTAVGIQADQYLSARLRLPGSNPSGDSSVSDRAEFGERVASAQQALVERLRAEPGVRGVAVANALPRMDHPIRWAELDSEFPSGASAEFRIRTAHVDPTYFDALGSPILAGRGFNAGDLDADSMAVIVNTSFVERALEGRNPIGRRVRYSVYEGEPGPWYEIVGVVGQLGMHVLQPEEDQGLYHPLVPGVMHPVRLAIHLGDDPESFTPRLRALASDVDPFAVIESPTALNKVFEGDWYLMAAMSLGGVVIIGVLLTLAASGIYALMSFAVAERTKEIGIRIALGADRRDIALAVARRSLVQIGIGVLLGLPLAGILFFEMFDDAGSTASAWSAFAATVGLGVGVMALVSLVACTAPTARALRIVPTDALKNEG